MNRRPPPGLRRRFDSTVLRWQARLEEEWVDRFLPWIAASVLFFLYFGLALARSRGEDTGTALAAAVQGVWLIGHGHAPDLTVTGTHLLARHFPLGMYPVAVVTRVLPIVPVLLALQSAGLAFAVVPLWRLARRIANLRAGPSLAIVVAYGASPTINDLALNDFHPAAVAVAPLMGATYLALRGRWRAFALVSIAAVIWSAELALVVAGIGVLLFLNGQRRAGRWTMVVALTYAVVAVLVLEPRFGSTGFIAPGAYHAYGSTFFSIVGGMLVHPFKVLGDLLAEDNVRLVIGLLAPLLFLPVLSPRHLVPAIPLTALYLVADISVRGSGTNEYGLPLTVFAFVAATFALARMGRPSIDRVLVDRRVLIALLVAAIGFFCIDATNSPYARPWNWGREDAADGARHEVADALPAATSVRATTTILPLVAQRRRVYVLDGPPDAASATDGVSRVLIDERDVGWTATEWDRFGTGMANRQFVLVYDQQEIRVYARLSG